MAHLSIALLGPFRVSLGGEPVSGFASDKVRALLAYLVLSPNRPHRREALAGLLWPEFPERSARANLRNSLANLRRVIGDHTANPSFLHCSRQTIQFNSQSDYWLDADAFEGLTTAESPTSDGLEQAVGLARGLFLEGFSLADAAPFEEWLLLRREHLARQVVETLHSLTAIYEGRGAYEPALAHARYRVELEPWQEDGQRQLMRLLAYSGQGSRALAQYETLCRSLWKELGAEPARETTELYEQIRDGKPRAGGAFAIRALGFDARPPPFLDEERVAVEQSVFVARERELAQLDRFLGMALAGQGRVVFVTGEAGSGKTALLQEFTRYAQDSHTDLLAASGLCNAYTGLGDPYLPFREILELLTGDVESKWEAGACTGDHARRLWRALPFAVRALVEAGPDLIDTFIPGAALLERIMTYAQWPGGTDGQTDLADIVEHRLFGSPQNSTPRKGVTSTQQGHIFKQYTSVLKALARQAPLMLVLDDLQWADTGSTSLLFHLGRQLAGSRILIVGAYRPEDVRLGRGAARHPLTPMVNEFRREFGDITVNVEQAEHRDFVEALLDSQPNRLGVAFRSMLYRQTRGHPLFTVELLRGLQDQGALVQDSDGFWVEGTALDQDTLPARVEAVIAERIGRLPQALQGALRVASVEGEAFTAEVVALVQAADEAQIVEQLSGQLDRRHRLVRAEGIQRLRPTLHALAKVKGSRAENGQRLSRYRFRHILFQRYLYHSLDEVERVHLHEAVGNTLEALYKGPAKGTANISAEAAGEATKGVAVQLAWHFQEAGITQKAIHYLRQAGERAVLLSAFQEGIEHLTQGLALLKGLPDSGGAGIRLERDEQELALQLALGIASIGHQAYGGETEKVYTRALELAQRLDKTSQLCLILGRLSMIHHIRSKQQKAREFAEQALRLAERAEDPLYIALGHRLLGCILFCLGEYTTAQAHLKQMISFYDPPHHHRVLVSLRGSDAGTSALAYNALCLWCLGYPDQAMRQSQEALTLAREQGHPFSLASVLRYAGGMFHVMRRDALALKVHAEELVRISDQQVPGWSGAGTFLRGEALSMLGQATEGMAQMHQSMAAHPAGSAHFYSSMKLWAVAKAQGWAGQTKLGLVTLAEALAVVEETGERHWEAEMCRLRADLLLAQGDEFGAEDSLQKAIAVAQGQSAKSWELRAATSLARLWQAQGRTHEARVLLAQIYGWFTEGFDTPDLKEARGLLNELL